MYGGQYQQPPQIGGISLGQQQYTQPMMQPMMIQTPGKNITPGVQLVPLETQFLSELNAYIAAGAHPDHAASLKYIIDLGNKYGHPVIGQGQNRIVLGGFNNQQDRVLKISHRYVGMVDNIGEYGISTLCAQDPLLQDNIAATLGDIRLNDSSYAPIIVQEKIDGLGEIHKARGSQQIGLDSAATLVENYIAYITLIKFLSTRFFLMDVHPSRSLNFGIKDGKMKVLDYGYFIPWTVMAHANTGLQIDNNGIRCPKCNSEYMEFHIPDIQKEYGDNITKARKFFDESQIEFSGEVYVCPNCSHKMHTTELYGLAAHG